VTHYRCTLLRIRPGWAGVPFMGPKQVGEPAVYDVDMGNGTGAAIRDVILAMMGADIGEHAVEDYRLRVEDVKTGEVLPDPYGATGNPAPILDRFTDEELWEEIRQRRQWRAG